MNSDSTRKDEIVLPGYRDTLTGRVGWRRSWLTGRLILRTEVKRSFPPAISEMPEPVVFWRDSTLDDMRVRAAFTLRTFNTPLRKRRKVVLGKKVVTVETKGVKEMK